MSNFSFIHISDHHLNPTEAHLTRGFSPAFSFRAVLRHIAENSAHKADFLVSSGDLANDPSEAVYRTFCHMVQSNHTQVSAPGPFPISIEGLHDFPMFVLPGNHDDREFFFRYLFPQTPPMPLMNLTFDHKGVQFICLDFGTKNKAVLHPEMLDFLRQALQRSMPSIILTHHNLVPLGSRWLDEFVAEDMERFWEVVQGKNLLAIFSGHVHITHEKVIHGIPLMGIRSTAFPIYLQDEPLLTLEPPHYRLVRVTDQQVSSQVFEVQL